MNQSNLCTPERSSASMLHAGSTARAMLFSLLAHDDELYHRMLSVLTGPMPNVMTARAVVKALKDKLASGYTLTTDTTQLLQVAERVVA